MLRKYFLLILLLSILSSFVDTTNAQNPDVRITNNLNKLNFKYDLKEDGTFQFTMPVGKRTQMILIHSNTSIYDNLELREIYSVIYQSNQRPDEVQMSKLLIDNGQKKLGAWELIFEENIYFVVFTAKIPGDLDDDDLKSVIDIVATSADAMEQILFTTDEW